MVSRKLSRLSDDARLLGDPSGLVRRACSCASAIDARKFCGKASERPFCEDERVGHRGEDWRASKGLMHKIPRLGRNGIECAGRRRGGPWNGIR